MLVDKGSTQYFASKKAGEKGYNLYLLENAGFNIPPFIILPAQLLSLFKRTTSVDDHINQIYDEEKSSKPLNFKSISEKIEDIILSTPIPKSVERLILNGIDLVGVTPIAVRPSPLLKISTTESFSNFLFVTRIEDIVKSVKKCWVQSYSKDRLYYANTNNIPLNDLNVSVILQRMVNSEKSGLSYTLSPKTGSPDKMAINAVYGIRNGLLPKKIEGDSYQVSKLTLKLEEESIALKKNKITHNKFIDEQGCSIEDIPREKQQKPILSTSEIRAISKVSKKIENFYHYPQKIEFSFERGKLFVIDVAPLSPPIINVEGEVHIWDKSQIIERIGRLTLPLTFDLFQKTQYLENIQFCQILGLSPQKILHLKPLLKNTNGIFFGRIYQNLTNTEKLMTFIPWSTLFQSPLEKILKLSSKDLQEEMNRKGKDQKLGPLPSQKYKQIFIQLKFLFLSFKITKKADKFINLFYNKYKKYKDLKLEQMTNNEVIKILYEIEEVFLTNIHPLLINNLIYKTYSEILASLINRWIPSQGEDFVNDLLSEFQFKEYKEPTIAMLKLVDIINDNISLRDLIQSSENGDLLEILSKSNFSHFYSEVLDYIKKFKFRCANVMELNYKDFHQDPEQLFTYIKNFLNSKALSFEDIADKGNKLRSESELKVKYALTKSPFKRAIFNWFLNRARELAKNESRMNLCKLKVQDLVRKLFQALGEDFSKRSIISKSYDIFYLTYWEILGGIEGTTSISNFKELILLRKKEYEKFREKEIDPQFVTRGLVYWNNLFSLEKDFPDKELRDIPKNSLKGAPLVDGIVEGIIKVIDIKNNDFIFNNNILVTKAITPNQVPLLPCAKGIILETSEVSSFSASISKEMGIPTILGVSHIMERVKSGMYIKMNGETGLIEILES